MVQTYSSYGIEIHNFLVTTGYTENATFTLSFTAFPLLRVKLWAFRNISTLLRMRTNTPVVSYLLLNYCTIFHCVVLIPLRFHEPCTRHIIVTPSVCGGDGRNKVNTCCSKNDEPWKWFRLFLTITVTSYRRGYRLLLVGRVIPATTVELQWTPGNKNSGAPSGHDSVTCCSDLVQKTGSNIAASEILIRDCGISVRVMGDVTEVT